MATNEQIVDALAPLAQQYGYDAAQFVPRAIETLDALAPELDDDVSAAPVLSSALTVDELRSMLAAEGLSTEGKKAELGARLADDMALRINAVREGGSDEEIAARIAAARAAAAA